MRRCASMIFVTNIVTAACGSTVNVDRERKVLLELDRQWSQTANDVDKFVSYYAADASMYPPGMPIAKGPGSIRQVYSKLKSTPGFSLHWTPTNAAVSNAGDLGYTT